MNKKKNHIFRKLSNLKVLFKYLKECWGTIMQGDSLADKYTLTLHFLRIPQIIFQSLVQNKDLIEIEQKYRVLRRDVRIRNEYGRFMCGNNILTVYPVTKEYENHFLPFFKLDEGIFVDVGAHIGKYSIMLANQMKDKGQVISIEPESENFKMLENNVLLNGLNNMKCINKGAFSRKDILNFYITDHVGEMYHSLYKTEEVKKEVQIEVDTLDHILSGVDLKRIDLIKIDTEGAELEVIKGAMGIITKFKPNIIIEVWTNDHLDQMTEMLGMIGYPPPTMIDEENYFFSINDK